jgi:hypothetical protein
MAVWRGGLTAVALVGAVLAGVACGDDDDAETLSEAEFAEEANGICAAGNERTIAIAAEIGPDSTEEELDAIVAQIADDSERQIAQLRELRPPVDVADEFAAALDQAEIDLQELRDIGGAVFSQAIDPFNETNDMLAELDLAACSGSGV